MPRKGIRSDKADGFHHVDKALKLDGASWIEPMGSVSLFEDFLIDVLADSPYVSVIQSGTPTTTGAITQSGGGTVSAGQGGWVGGKTQNVDAEIDELVFSGIGSGTTGTNWRPEKAGNGMIVMEMGLVIPTALTARQYYCGWSDAPTRGTAHNGPLNIQTAYTIVDDDTNAAGFVFSSLATAPTIWKYGWTNAGTESTASAGTEGVTGVVDSYTVCRVEIDSAGNAYFFQSASGATTIGRQNPVMIGAGASAVAATAGMLPKFTAAPTTTTGVEWEVDYCFVASARA